MEVSAPASIAEAERIQDELRQRLDLATGLASCPSEVAGLDVAYQTGTRRLAAAVVVVGLPELEVKETAIARGEVTFPYVPGLLAFREAPILLEALGKLTRQPEVLVCDGYGVAHPRRFGLACHIGVLTGLPTFGVAKTSFTATFDEPGNERGEWSSLIDANDVVGRALRTRTGVKPVFVSVGNRIGLECATELTLRMCNKFRIPEAIRRADSLSRHALHAATSTAREDR
jgi:deoxyribonuclease V